MSITVFITTERRLSLSPKTAGDRRQHKSIPLLARQAGEHKAATPFIPPLLA